MREDNNWDKHRTEKNGVSKRGLYSTVSGIGLKSREKNKNQNKLTISVFVSRISRSSIETLFAKSFASRDDSELCRCIISDLSVFLVIFNFFHHYHGQLRHYTLILMVSCCIRNNLPIMTICINTYLLNICILLITYQKYLDTITHPSMKRLR